LRQVASKKNKNFARYLIFSHFVFPRSICQAKTQLLNLCPLMGRELAPFLRRAPFICLLCEDSGREEKSKLLSSLEFTFYWQSA
jgi:hypothetical protein